MNGRSGIKWSRSSLSQKYFFRERAPWVVLGLLTGGCSQCHIKDFGNLADLPVCNNLCFYSFINGAFRDLLMVKWMVFLSGISIMVPVFGFFVVRALRFRREKLPKPRSSILLFSVKAFLIVVSMMSRAAVTSRLGRERSMLTWSISSFFNMFCSLSFKKMIIKKGCFAVINFQGKTTFYVPRQAWTGRFFYDLSALEKLPLIFFGLSTGGGLHEVT